MKNIIIYGVYSFDVIVGNKKSYITQVFEIVAYNKKQAKEILKDILKKYYNKPYKIKRFALLNTINDKDINKLA